MKYLQLAHTGACTKLKRKTYKFTDYKFTNFTISTFWSVYKAEKKIKTFYIVAYTITSMRKLCDST